MRVLIMAGIYFLSGASNVIENLADQLGKKGLDITIGALDFKRIPPKGNYKVKTINLYNISKLKRFLNSFDILHSHHPLNNYLALFSNKPFVYHYHGAPDIGRGILFKLSMLISIKIMKNAFDAVITVSESGARELNRYFGFDNLDVIYNGVDTDHFKTGLYERFRKGTPQFLFVGNLYEHKKVEELIHALNEVLKEYPSAHLQIVGEGYAYKILINLIKKLHLQENVALVGRVSDIDLPFYYASCDLYVTASRYETFGLPLLEAMACGKPVVASSIPPHVELLSKSKAGVTYNIGDFKDLSKKMIMIYETRDRYKNDAINFANKYNWSVVTEKVIRVYDRTISNFHACAREE